MDRFSKTLRDMQGRNDFLGGIGGARAFHLFKRLLNGHYLSDAWNRFKQDELRQMVIQWCEEHGMTFRQTQL
jgi:hypothetical protein